MRKPRDYDAELKALDDRAKDLKVKKVSQLGELVIATGADSLSADELAGALIMLAETKDAAKQEAGPSAARRGFGGKHGDLHRQMTATETALRRNRAARYRHRAQKARSDMRSWQVERRKRTKRLIELGGLVVKSGVVDLTNGDRAVILGSLIWMADKLKSDERERALALWAGKGKEAFAEEEKNATHNVLPWPAENMMTLPFTKVEMKSLPLLTRK